MDLMWNVRSVFFMYIVLIWNSVKGGRQCCVIQLWFHLGSSKTPRHCAFIFFACVLFHITCSDEASSPTLRSHLITDAVCVVTQGTVGLQLLRRQSTKTGMLKHMLRSQRPHLSAFAPLVVNFPLHPRHQWKAQYSAGSGACRA